MCFKVRIVESERGYGQRVDSVLEFPTQEEADVFVAAFNAKNDKNHVPDWYMYAEHV